MTTTWQGPDLSRPRSARVHEAVLRATRELLDEGGLGAATTDAMSQRSGVSKATIYKHWPSRIAVAAEAVGERMAAAIPAHDEGDVRADLRAQIRDVSRFYASAEGRVFAQLLAAAVDDAQGAAYVREFFLAARREVMSTLWERALARGEVRADVDVDVVIDALAGPLVFRLLTGHAPLTDANADLVVDLFLRGALAQASEA